MKLIFQTFELLQSLRILALRSTTASFIRVGLGTLALSRIETDQLDLFLEHDDLLELPFDHFLQLEDGLVMLTTLQNDIKF